MIQYLPASIRFPLGYTVAIKMTTRRALKRLAQEDVDGCWLGQTRTIFIDQAVDEATQWYTLTHEMIHAFADWQHHVLLTKGHPR